MRRGFSLIEIIFVLVLASILSMGSFKALEALFIRSAKAKAVSDLALESQIVLNQLSSMLYHRIPNSVIGYDGSSDCDPIEELDANNVVLEWLALADDAMLQGEYDGFVDMNASDKASKTLSAPHIKTSLDTSNLNLVFAGAFDDGAEDIGACNGAFGWHGNSSDLAYDFKVDTSNVITFIGALADYIYEKYYLSSGGIAVTRGEHVSDIANCGVSASDFKNFNNTLFLFYDFYPYQSQTYCGDGGSGKVVVLAEDVSGFKAAYINDTIHLSIDMNRSIRGSNPVHISKQKAIF
ncbi:MAG: type II secretion system protein [Campylobacterota bacterium]|nr:type II secretion system protein [Campylobacterota bacterium]